MRAGARPLAFYAAVFLLVGFRFLPLLLLLLGLLLVPLSDDNIRVRQV